MFDSLARFSLFGFPSGARIALCLVLTGLLLGAGHAQATGSPSPEDSRGATTTAPATKPSPSGDRVILKVGDVQVKQEDFESGVGNFEGEKEEAPAEKDRRKLGDDYASVLMLSQKALAEHLDSTPEVSRQLAIDRLQTLSNAEFDSLMRQAQPTSGEVSQYYSAHLSDYDEVQIRRLFIWKRGGDSKNSRGLAPQVARTRADAILRASAAGRDATKLAEEFKGSDGGLLDPKPLTFPRGELPPAMEKVAFAIKEGEWGQVEDTPDAIMLVQMVKRDRQQLGQVSSAIETQLQGQKMQAMLDNLKRNSGIWMDEKYFGTAVAPVPGVQRPVPNPQSKLQKSATKGESTSDKP